jgi:hypothetical protein
VGIWYILWEFGIFFLVLFAPRKIWQPCFKGVVTRNSDFVSRDRICVVRSKLEPFNLCRTTKFCVVRLNLCTQYDQSL